ncbi:PREDICTED: protein FAM98A [Nicrophorus vespilloides]|uniref:Protein FAM98A n=1 Tax=Nicrophorus vespilloides TaxID=110193 RepID=A0ABM1M6N6_NICVS|nr:PREDICTED: protein FAM98A [Nicrophorus vespilloides]
MVEKITEALRAINYKGPYTDQAKLEELIVLGLGSLNFFELIVYLTNEIRVLYKLDENVSPVTSLGDTTEFIMELSSFLRELGCPHEKITQGHVSGRLSELNDKMVLMQYLVGEVMTARILKEKKVDNQFDLKLQESAHASNLSKILQTLNIPKPPANLSLSGLFQKLHTTVTALVHKAPEDLVGKPICNFSMQDKHWEILQTVHRNLDEEYSFRREMMLTRLDCTVQSFKWSDSMKGKDEIIKKAYADKRKQLRVEPNVRISDLLSARSDIAIIEKTSNAGVRKNTQTSINKVLIGQVPDRGGRTNEQAAPPREMPSWTAGGGRGDFRGRGFGHRGNHDNQNAARAQMYRQQAEQAQSTNQSDNYSQRGGYQRQSQSDQPRGRGSYRRGHGHDDRYSDNNTRVAYDSAGSYGSDSFEPKRARTYDNYQNTRINYADQYVQETQQNQQYNSRRGTGGRSRGSRSGRGRGYY